MGLESLVSEDSRRPIERLRRTQLWAIAKAYDLPFPAGAPKTAMIPIIEGAGIDVTKPLPNDEQLLQQIPVQDENGNTRIELFPVEKPHATQNKDIDYDAILAAKAETAEKDEQLEQSKTEIAELKEMVAKLMAKMEGSDGVVSEKTTESFAYDSQTDEITLYADMKMPELRKAAKRAGINSYGLKKAEIIEKLSK